MSVFARFRFSRKNLPPVNGSLNVQSESTQPQLSASLPIGARSQTPCMHSHTARWSVVLVEAPPRKSVFGRVDICGWCVSNRNRIGSVSHLDFRKLRVRLLLRQLVFIRLIRTNNFSKLRFVNKMQFAGASSFLYPLRLRCSHESRCNSCPDRTLIFHSVFVCLFNQVCFVFRIRPGKVHSPRIVGAPDFGLVWFG